jgi:hypothetical protein
VKWCRALATLQQLACTAAGVCGVEWTRGGSRKDAMSRLFRREHSTSGGCVCVTSLCLWRAALASEWVVVACPLPAALVIRCPVVVCTPLFVRLPDGFRIIGGKTCLCCHCGAPRSATEAWGWG